MDITSQYKKYIARAERKKALELFAVPMGERKKGKTGMYLAYECKERSIKDGI